MCSISKILAGTPVTLQIDSLPCSVCKDSMPMRITSVANVPQNRKKVTRQGCKSDKSDTDKRLLSYPLCSSLLDESIAALYTQWQSAHPADHAHQTRLQSKRLVRVVGRKNVNNQRSIAPDERIYLDTARACERARVGLSHNKGPVKQYLNIVLNILIHGSIRDISGPLELNEVLEHGHSPSGQTWRFMQVSSICSQILIDRNV